MIQARYMDAAISEHASDQSREADYSTRCEPLLVIATSHGLCFLVLIIPTVLDNDLDSRMLSVLLRSTKRKRERCSKYSGNIVLSSRISDA